MKLKSVAVVSIFVAIMAISSVYMTQQRALADAGLEPEPQCTLLYAPSVVEAEVGEEFTVSVLIDDVKNFWGYEVGIKYDRSVLEYVGARTPHWKFVWGRIEFLFWVAGTKAQNGEVELMEFTFKAKTEGVTSLSFYEHKLATLKYLDFAHANIGWPIPHMVAEGLVVVG